ncbi:hypothetical protein MLD38_040700 [Melastoma candidum]|nr:hypothetical protein MLD38_040700 [Melastoma candidum]
MCRSTLGLCQLSAKYNIKNISVLQRLGGAGYRVRARLKSVQSKRWERLKAAVQKPFGGQELPLEWWIGRGKPLNPYLRGRIVECLFAELEPEQLSMFPDDMVTDAQREHLERTLLYQWMLLWLRWIKEYHLLKMKRDVNLSDFFNQPICQTSWKPKEVYDINQYRFGILWKCYDLGANWTYQQCPVWVLDTGSLQSGWIRGGAAGTDFVMELDVPNQDIKTRRGV